MWIRAASPPRRIHQIYQYIECWEYFSSYCSCYSCSVTTPPPTTNWWRHLMPAILTAPTKLGHMPPATYWPPPANCPLPTATCQLTTDNCHLATARFIFYNKYLLPKKKLRQTFFLPQFFFPPEFFSCQKTQNWARVSHRYSLWLQPSAGARKKLPAVRQFF